MYVCILSMNEIYLFAKRQPQGKLNKIKSVANITGNNNRIHIQTYKQTAPAERRGKFTIPTITMTIITKHCKNKRRTSEGETCLSSRRWKTEKKTKIVCKTFAE